MTTKFRVSPVMTASIPLQKNVFDKKRQASLVFFGAPSGTRTLDPLIKSQLLYQLS